MKTKLKKFIFIAFALCATVFLSTSAFAQSSYQAQIAELQQIEASLTNDIAVTQASIAEYQDLVSMLDAQIADALNNGGDATALQTQRQEALNIVSSLQTTLAQQQGDLTAAQNKIIVLTDAMNQTDKNWILANNPPAPYQPPVAQRIVTVPNPSIPSTMNVIFQSTGDAAQDAQIVHDWLLQHGLTK